MGGREEGELKKSVVTMKTLNPTIQALVHSSAAWDPFYFGMTKSKGKSLSWLNREKEFNSIVKDLESFRLPALLKPISLLSVEKDLKRQITVRDV